MFYKKIALLLLLALLWPQVAAAQVTTFELSSANTSYQADGLSEIKITSSELKNLPDGTLFQIILSKAETVYGGSEPKFSDYFEAMNDADSGTPGFQVAVQGGKLSFSFKAGVIAGNYEITANYTSATEQYQGLLTLQLKEFKPLVIQNVDLNPERPDLKRVSKVMLESYTTNPSYNLEFKPIQLINKDGKRIFQLNIWIKRTVLATQEVPEKVTRYDQELVLPSVQEAGEYTLRIYQNGTVTKEHVFNIEPASTVWLFKDLNNKHWAYNYVKALTEAGMVNGYPDGTFKPERSITRAEFLKVVLKGAKIKILTGLPSAFNDVAEDSWYKDYVMTAKGLGIINGYEDDSFRPDQPILRQEATKVILEAFQIPTIRVIDPTFDDVTEEWLSYVETGVVYDFWHGREPRRFEPRDYITRAEVAKIVDRIWDLQE